MLAHHLAVPRLGARAGRVDRRLARRRPLPLERRGDLAARGAGSRRDRGRRARRSSRASGRAGSRSARCRSRMHTEAYSIDELARGLRFARRAPRADGVVRSSRRCRPTCPGAVAALRGAARGRRRPLPRRSPTTTPAARCRTCTAASACGGRSGGGHRGGRRVLVWYTDSPHGVAYMEGNLVGLAESADVAEDLLPEYLAALASRPYPYSARLMPGSASPTGPRLTRAPYRARPAPPARAERHRRQRAARARPGGGRRETGTPAAPTRGCVSRRTASSSSAPRSASATRLADARGRLDGLVGRRDRLGRTGARLQPPARRRAVRVRADAARARRRARRAGARVARQRSDRAYASMALFDEHTWGAANPWDGRARAHGARARLQWRREGRSRLDAYDRATRCSRPARSGWRARSRRARERSSAPSSS